jgi:hypothetical protein
MPRMRAAAAGSLLLVSLAFAACGGGSAPADPRDREAIACRGTRTGADALRADGRPAVRRVERAMKTAARAASALAGIDPAGGTAAERHAEAVRALQGQGARLRAVRDQVDRGSPPGAVLSAARASLEDGDRQAARRLAAVGIDCG